MQLRPVRLESRFAELGGFVLVDPVRLDAFCGGSAAGTDLLTPFTQSDDGDRVAREGVAVPVVQLEPAYYDVVVRGEGSPPVSASPRVRSPGWVVGTDTGRLLLCGLGALVSWDPDDPRHAVVEVPPGWYVLDLLTHALHAGEPGEEWVVELVLHPAAGRPAFEADMSLSLGLDASG